MFDCRRILYTTNAIEALNAKLRGAVRARGHFPTDEAATKLLFLVLNRSEKEWIMPPREWCMAKAQFAVLFGERFTTALQPWAAQRKPVRGWLSIEWQRAVIADISITQPKPSCSIQTATGFRRNVWSI